MNISQKITLTTCENCNKLVDTPKHCGKPMELSNNRWICWKGEHEPCCGRPAIIEYEACCDNPTISK